MWFVGIGVLMLVMHFGGIGPVGQWVWADKWWVILSPFPMAIIWWAFVDSTGWTQKKAMDKVDAMREARRQQHLVNLGLDAKSQERRRKG